MVPFISQGGRAFDPATAPSIVRLKVVDPSGNVPTSEVFVTFVGVGGRNYGGKINREGALELIMPSGRYYADFLVIDTKLGPPPNPPAFFLNANEERDFGALVLSKTSQFVNTSLENEVSSTLEEANTSGGSGSVKGFSKVFSLIVKLLLSILQEIRSLRAELLSR